MVCCGITHPHNAVLSNRCYTKKAKITLHRRRVRCSIPCLAVFFHFVFCIIGVLKALPCADATQKTRRALIKCGQKYVDVN